MRKYYYIIGLLGFMLACTDNTRLTESDLDKYSWLNPFLIEYDFSDFNGTHNTDLGILKFDFIVEKNKNLNLLLKFDSIANREQWKIDKSAEFERTYSKLVSKGDNINLNIQVDKLTNRAYFRIKNIVSPMN